MTKIKPALPRGMRDFSPEEMQRRTYILNTIEEVYQRYGFQQIETPAMEKREVLMGKYGAEGDKLIFNVLNSGDYLKDIPNSKLETRNSKKLTPDLSKRALRYDLTVPLARYVAQHQHEIAFPFKRYQIQPVWRADKPQKGRYREFYQCDADVIGPTSLYTDAELMAIFSEAFQELGLDGVMIRFNHRQLLYSITQKIGIADQFIHVTIAIDKLDKVGIEGVQKELGKIGLSDQQIEELTQFLRITGSNNDIYNALEQSLGDNDTGAQALSEIKTILNYLADFEQSLVDYELDPTLARGLDYYTGTIYEVEANNVDIGSIAAGGRYDDLCSTFGLDDVSGIGISFGVDRIYDVMEELDLFPEKTQLSTEVLFINFKEVETQQYFPYLQQLRDEGINTELYPDARKLGKQFKYANKKGIPFVIVAGPDELKNGKFELKEMESGEQTPMEFDKIIDTIKKK